MSKYTAQPYVFDAAKYRQSHRRLIAGVGGKVADVFDKTAKKIAKIGLSTGFDSDTEEFKWSDYPVQQRQAEKAVNGMLKDLVSAIEQGQVAAWDASNLKNDEMVKAILPTTDLPEDIVASFMPRNAEALKAFQERKVAGMSLSQRIWSFKEQSEREFEMALDVALGTGKSASALSRDIRLSLKEPNNLFRRVRDKHGNLVPSKAMQAHHPGRGVYHSSYKNALRVAATETNMAYRHADNTRWRGMGFVLGIEVSTSINHHEPHPDMCDELAGLYPLDFEFVGWHPFCRCWAAPKLADRKEMEAYLDALQDGKDVSDYAFTGRVEDVPQGFKDWVEANKARIENAANKPYFIRDNYVDGDPSKGFKFSPEQKRKEWLERMKASADARHAARTPEQEEAIRQRWEDRKARIAEERARIEAEKAAEADKAAWRARLKAAADKRHAERTPQKVAGIKRRWENLQKQHEAWQHHAESILQLAQKYPNDIDLATLQKHLAEKQFAKMEIEAKAIEKQLAKIEKQMVKVREVFPFADQYHADFTVEEMLADSKAVKAKLKAIEKSTLDVQKRYLEAEIKAAPNALWERALKTKLEDVKFDIQVRDMGVKLTPLTAYAQNTKLPFYKDLLDAVQKHMTKVEIAFAEAELDLAEQILPLVQRYDDVITYKSKAAAKSRFHTFIKDFEDHLEVADIAGAEKALQDAEAFKRQGEYNAKMAALRKQRKAKEAAEAAAKAKEAEMAAGAHIAEKKGYDVLEDDFFTPERTIADAKNFSDVKEIMGDELPVLMQKYEESIAREGYTSAEYLAARKEIERKLKDFFDAHDFGHWEKSYLLDESILDNGFLTNRQIDTLQGSGYSGYGVSRATYGHWAYGLHPTQSIKVKKKDLLKDGEYYRCGIPVNKDKTQAWHDNGTSGFGDCHVRFRKDRVLTTFTLDNSLCTDMIPSLTCDPKVVSLDAGNLRNYAADKYTSMRQLKGSFGNYMEIQYLPKGGSERLMPRDVESIVLPRHPLDVHPQRIWDRWKKEGVDIFYYDSSKDRVVLFAKGDPIVPALTKEEIAKTKVGAEHVLKHIKDYVNADLPRSDFKALQDAMKSAEYGQAKIEVQKLKAKILSQRAKIDELTDLIPNAHELHADFTIEEMQAAREAIQKKFAFLEKKTAGNLDKYIDKLEFEVKWLEDPAHRKHRTWQIARDAYQRKAVEIRTEMKRKAMEEDLAKLKKSKTKARAYTGALNEAEALLQAGKLDEAAAKLKEAKDYLESIGEAVEQRILKLGESVGVKFDADELKKAREEAMALITNHDDPQAAFNAADKIMSKYAEDLWGRLTDEEKHVAYLYTSGSRYINEPLYGGWYCKTKYGIDGLPRSSERDANILTSIIEKAKPLEKPMWVEHTEDFGAFLGRFGIDLRGMSQKAAQQYIGTEAVNLPFMSTSCAADSYFAKLMDADFVREVGYMGNPLNINMRILLPAGTKGIYCEPFAHFGDGRGLYGKTKDRYGTAAVKWKGDNRHDAGFEASDQVEFLIQRGAKFRIKALKKVGSKWEAELELIEHTDVKPTK